MLSDFTLHARGYVGTELNAAALKSRCVLSCANIVGATASESMKLDHRKL